MKRIQAVTSTEHELHTLMVPGQRVINIEPEAPSKPATGSPCNGCGVCCLVEPCPLGMLVSRRRRGACAALRWTAEDSRYSCGALSDPVVVLGRAGRWPWVQRWVARWIAAGQGCDAHLTAEHSPNS